MLDISRLADAYDRVRRDLIGCQTIAGPWTGQLASSPLATATAVSALALVRQQGSPRGRAADACPDGQDTVRLISRGLTWLADRQTSEGGWGDTDRSHPNIATTLLAMAAFRLTGVPARHGNVLERAHDYVRRQGGISALRRRYGRDKTFAAPILTNCALAGMISWRHVPALPFELACFPQSTYRFLRLPVVSYAIPALVAAGQARYHFRKPYNPLTRYVRRWALTRSLQVVARMQPRSGGFLEAVPLTSFVVMSLAATGHATHPVVSNGLRFLRSTVRPDGCWPIDTNLATWNTTLAITSLASGTEPFEPSLQMVSWLLSCQHTRVHPFTGAQPGGWGWTDLAGAVPDADDTSGALLALARLRDQWHTNGDGNSAVLRDVSDAAESGLRWLLDLQNRDGGWPTFCRGWGKLPFDRSGADLTAHALRALWAWRSVDTRRVLAAIDRGFRYLDRQQRADGSWIPLWFGNQDHAQEWNPVYGTARVLLAYRDLGRLDMPAAQQARHWLLAAQNQDGGWGGGPVQALWKGKPTIVSSVEETALAVEALLAFRQDHDTDAALDRGLYWLIQRVQTGQHVCPSPIGLYFAKLWYYEQLYPLVFTAAALGAAVRHAAPSEQELASPKEAGL